MVKNNNLNVTEIRDSDFKNVYLGIFRRDPTQILEGLLELYQGAKARK